MPLLLFIVLVALIATFGFWDTLSAILGGIVVVMFIAIILGFIAVLLGVRAWRRFWRRLGRPRPKRDPWW